MNAIAGGPESGLGRDDTTLLVQHPPAVAPAGLHQREHEVVPVHLALEKGLAVAATLLDDLHLERWRQVGS